MGTPIAARLSDDQLAALDYVGQLTGKKRADLIVDALEGQYRLSNRVSEARSFFAKRVRLIEQHVQEIGGTSD